MVRGFSGLGGQAAVQLRGPPLGTTLVLIYSLALARTHAWEPRARALLPGLQRQRVEFAQTPLPLRPRRTDSFESRVDVRTHQRSLVFRELFEFIVSAIESRRSGASQHGPLSNDGFVPALKKERSTAKRGHEGAMEQRSAKVANLR